MIKLNSIDLFSGIGGLSLGLKEAGFNVLASIEIDKYAVKGYKLNHPETIVYNEDIRNFDAEKIKNFWIMSLCIFLPVARHVKVFHL